MSALSQTEVIARKTLGDQIAMHWIGGQWVESDRHNESINPATGEVIGSYADGGRKEAELAVSAAVRAFQETDWKDTTGSRVRLRHNSKSTREELQVVQITRQPQSVLEAFLQAV